jgi:hypothetical protein
MLLSGASLAHGINEFYGNPDVEPSSLLSVSDSPYLRDCDTNHFTSYIASPEDQTANDWCIGYAIVECSKATTETENQYSNDD